MPWRKYPATEGKFGPIYQVSRGIQVRMDKRGKWTIFINKSQHRRNKTVGSGRKNLCKAIKAAEILTTELEVISNTPSTIKVQETPQLPQFSSFSKEWLEDNASCWRDSTFERYEGILRIHILPHSLFRDKRIDQIERVDVKKFLRKLWKKRSPASVELAHTVISSIFEEAIDSNLLQVNPAAKLLKKILPPKRKRNLSDPKPMNSKEVQLFLAASEKHCSLPEQLILDIMLNGGFRLGEALAFHTKNMDFDKKVYQVKESFKRHKFNKPKSSEYRWVDLPDFLMPGIKKLIKFQKKVKLSSGKKAKVEYLFADPAEDFKWPLSQRKIQDLVKRVCKKADLEQRSPHDLRHTYASTLLMKHISPAYVQKQLGHSSIDITVDTYGHWIQGEGREGLEEALGAVRNRDENCIFLHMHKQQSE